MGGRPVRRAWVGAAEHGHLLAPLDATFRGYRVGIGLNNATSSGSSARTRSSGGTGWGAWVSNQRSRAATLTPERIEQLTAIGMRWA
ncbi:helicase associated domain-containing protein [Streptomyces sp. NPDC058290]|uniref:helicase associated domain-containing protein n=1 Tax=Streptomyces sp. NPDC058290 TaxID=3346426 RepID=UPI0036ECA2E9